MRVTRESQNFFIFVLLVKKDVVAVRKLLLSAEVLWDR